MTIYTKAMAFIERICLVLSAIALIVMATVLMYQVIMRYFFSNATSWSDEVATTMFVWSVMLAIPIGIRRHEHVAVEFFVNKLPGLGLRIANILIQLLTAGTMAIIGYFAIQLLPSAERQTLSGISLTLGFPISMYWVYIAVPIGCAITILFCLERIFAYMLNRPQWEEENLNEIDEIIAADLNEYSDVSAPEAGSEGGRK